MICYAVKHVGIEIYRDDRYLLSVGANTDDNERFGFFNRLHQLLE